MAVQFVPGDPDHFSKTEFLAFGAAAIAFIAGGLVLMRLGRIPADAHTPRIAMLRAERLQGRRHIALMLMPLSLGFMLPGAIRAAGDVADGRLVTHIDMFTAAAFTSFSLLFALMIAGRGLDRWAKPVLDDELSRELRSRAIALGYFVVLLGAAALFVVSLVSRPAAVDLIPVVMALGVAGPAIRLFIARARGRGRRRRGMIGYRLRNRLKDARAELGLTQTELALRVGVSRKTINTVENEVFVPSTSLALALAAAFERPVEALFYLSRDED